MMFFVLLLRTSLISLFLYRIPAHANFESVKMYFFSHISSFFFILLARCVVLRFLWHFVLYYIILYFLGFIFNNLLLFTFITCNTLSDIQSYSQRTISLFLIFLSLIYVYFFTQFLFSKVFTLIFMPTAAEHITSFKAFKFKSIFLLPFN